MNVRQLAQIIAVAEKGSISHAAEALHISQPPLTRMIRKVEEELGSNLFLRTSKGIELTDAGKSFVEDAALVLQMHERMVNNARRIAQGLMGEFNLGIYGSTAYQFVPGVIRRFRADYPDVKLNLTAMDGSELLVALRNRSVAIGFTPLAEAAPDMMIERIVGEQMMIALPEHHPLVGQEVIAPSELATTPLILMSGRERLNYLHLAAEIFQNAGAMPRITHEVTEPLACLSLVSGGFGFALVAESNRHLPFKGVVYRRFDVSNPPRIDLSCVYLANNPSVMLRAFLKAVRSSAGQK